MPASALRYVEVDHTAPLAAMGALLRSLVHEEAAAPRAPAAAELVHENEIMLGKGDFMEHPGRFVEYFACDTWADYLRRFDRFTAGDERLQQRRHAFHIAETAPRISRYVAKHPAVKR